jgi:hypothetical protein
MEQRVPGWITGYRVFFALLTIVAIVVQFVDRIGKPNFNPVSFFSFFTMQGNIISLLVLLWGASGYPGARSQQQIDLIRGAAVLYISMVGVVYGILLADLQEQLQTTIPWVDRVIHKIMPLVMVFDWLMVPPKTPLVLRNGLIWLIYPVFWLIYTMVRGPLVGWYPYPFLDPAQTGGYGAVALYCLGITLGTLLFAWAVVNVGRRLRLVIAQ